MAPAPAVPNASAMPPRGWIGLRLGDVCSKIGSGATPRGGSSVYLETSDTTLIRSQNVYNDGFHHDGLVHISDEHATKLSNVEVEPDDVLLNITGDSVARCCQVDTAVLPARVNQHVAIVRPDLDKLDAGFLRYYLISPRMQATMLSWAGAGGTRRALNKEMIESFQVLAPASVDEQRAIAGILGAIDDKIELSRRMNQTLEAMAQAIFKSWFVDFDPVRAKAEGRDPVGLAPEIVELFPDALRLAEGHVIPNGWTVVPLGDVCEFAYGKALKASLRLPGNVPVMGSNGRIGWHDASLVRGPGIVVGRKGNPGTVTWVNDDFYPIDTTFFVVSRMTTVPLVYLYYALDGIGLPNLSADSAVPGLNRNMAYFSQLMLPSVDALKAFSQHIGLLHRSARQNRRMTRVLAGLRDALLPRLISGELRVPDAESIIARST